MNSTLSSNSTIPSNSTGAILCSLDGRRSPAELYVKLFVVHFITLGFFFHLARRRDGTYLGWNWMLYILAPLNIVVRYLFGLLGILILWGCKFLFSYVVHERQSESLESLYHPLRWLFGKAPDDGYSALPTSDNGNEVPGDGLAKKIGKAFVNGVFLTQCAGAIFLYSRRHQRDAATFIDQRVFELACGGLVVGILNLGLSFNLPIFKDRVPEDEKTIIDRFALFCRDSCSKHLLAFDEEYPHWLRFFKNLGISLIILLVTHDEDLYSAFSNIKEKFRIRSAEDPDILIIVFTTVGLPIICGALYLPFQLYKEYQTNNPTATLSRHPFLRWIFSPIFAFLVVLWMCVSFYVMVGLVFTIWSYVGFWFFAFQQVRELSVAPADVACPMLWSDPLAEYIWWLA
jgi:hypothetical protein